MPKALSCASNLVLLALLLLLAGAWPTATGLAAGKPASTTILQLRATVLPSTVTANLTIETSGGSEALIVRVRHGVPPYSVTLENAALARVERIDAATFRITGRLEGSTLMHIRDSKSGAVSCDLQVRSCLIAP